MTNKINRLNFLPIIWGITLYLVVKIYYPAGTIGIIRLTQYFALSALVFIYIALLTNALRFLYPRNFSGFEKYEKVLLFSAALMGLLHALFALFGELGGFDGLMFLGGTFLVAIIFSASALLLLLVLQIKFVKLLLYIAGMLVVVHAFLIGTHFSSLSWWIPKVVFLASSLLVILYSKFLDRFTKSLSSLSAIALLTFIFAKYFAVPSNTLNTFGIHEAHLKNSVNNASQNAGTDSNNIHTYKVNFNYENQGSKKYKLNFEIFDNKTGERVENFNVLHEKLAHLIIVDQKLENFSHIHPVFDKGKFSIEFNFTNDSLYRLYINFYPKGGGSEQNFNFIIPIGNINNIEKVWEDEMVVKKESNGYLFEMTNEGLKRESLNSGNDTINFKIGRLDGKDFKLENYLGAPGHLVMINTETFEYIHVHPMPEEEGSKEISFSPVGLNSGIYRLFIEINPNNTLIKNDFTVKIE